MVTLAERCRELRTIETQVHAGVPVDQSERIRQAIKWTVYVLLVVNWGFYIADDWRAAQFTVMPGDSIARWMNAYATSLDELAWFTMLFLFEAETYWISKETMSALKRASFVLVRFACYAFLAHTVYAYIFNYVEASQAVALAAADSACDVLGQGFSFLRNNDYTVIDAGNCAALSTGGTFYQIGGAQVVTDGSGLAETMFLYAIDIEDAIVWLAVVLVIELKVMLQERDIADGPWITGCNWLTTALYAMLLVHAAIWAWKGHWYAWDQLLWIGGFAAIEMNLSDWRDDIHEEAAAT